MGHHQSDRLPVRGSQICGEGIGERVGCSQHGRLDCHPCECRTQEHIPASLQIHGMVNDSGESGGQPPPSFQRVTLRHGIASIADECFERVGQRIDPGQSGDAGRLRQGQNRVEHCNTARSTRVATRHLHVGFGVADQRKGLGFTPRSGRRRNGDHWQQRSRCLPNPPIVVDSSPAGIDEIDPLRTVHTGTAAESYDQIGTERLRHAHPFVHMAGGGVLGEVMEPDHLQVGVL